MKKQYKTTTWVIVIVLVVTISMTTLAIVCEKVYQMTLEYFPLCDFGPSGEVLYENRQTQQCECKCLGIKVGRDLRPVDGDKYSVCIGKVITRTCQDYAKTDE